jgi:hypothetical protein
MGTKFNTNKYIGTTGRRLAKIRDGSNILYCRDGIWYTDVGNGPQTLASLLGMADVNNFTATAAPTVNDDSGDGYELGSMWYDTVAQEAYRCLDPALGAAVWIESTFDAVEAAALATAAKNAALTPPVYDAGNALTGAVTLNWSNGTDQKGSMTGAVTLNAPSNGSDNKSLTIWLTASGADRDLDFHADILKPSDSGLVLPKTLTSGKVYIVKLRYNGALAKWCLISIVGGYA